MQDPCNPTPHHVHPVIHHHPPGQVIGRIRRHGTHRIAQRLHAIAGACAAGPPLVIGTTTLKAVAPALAWVGLTTLASSVSAPVEQPAASFGGSAGELGAGTSGTMGVPPHKQHHPTHRPVSVPEPPSFALLLLVTAGWVGLRLGMRRVRS